MNAFYFLKEQRRRKLRSGDRWEGMKRVNTSNYSTLSRNSVKGQEKVKESEKEELKKIVYC